MKHFKSVCIIFDTEMEEVNICRLANYDEMTALFSKIKPDNAHFYPGQQAIDFIEELLEKGLV